MPKPKCRQRLAGTDDPNHVYVIGTAESKEAFDAFTSSSELQEAMKKAGVISQPGFTVLEGANSASGASPQTKAPLRRGFLL